MRLLINLKLIDDGVLNGGLIERDSGQDVLIVTVLELVSAEAKDELVTELLDPSKDVD